MRATGMAYAKKLDFYQSQSHHLVRRGQSGPEELLEVARCEADAEALEGGEELQEEEAIEVAVVVDGEHQEEVGLTVEGVEVDFPEEAVSGEEDHDELIQWTVICILRKEKSNDTQNAQMVRMEAKILPS